MSVEVSRLANGLRVVSETRRSIETAAIGLWVDVGSRFEPLALSGITHCLEHMLFKGTRRRTARDIAFEIEAVGGHMNAYTSREHTTYYARVLKEDTALALDILADILRNSLLDPGELKREQEVIVQEIGQAFDTPDDIIFDHLQEVAFEGHSLGRSILGTPDSVRGLKDADLHAFIKERYHAGALVVSAVGNIDHATLVTQVQDLLGDVPMGAKSGLSAAQFVAGEHRDVRDLEQVHLALAWEGQAFNGPDYYALQVASMLLGGGMSSRLFQEVREERGLAYSVYSFASSHHDTGLFSIYAGTSPGEAAEMLRVTKGQVEAMAAQVSADELAVGKAQLKAGLLMGIEATSSRMEQLGRHMLIHGRPLSTSDLIDAIDRVDEAAVQRLMGQMVERAPAFVALGDKGINQLSW